jgi:hypothetical protein
MYFGNEMLFACYDYLHEMGRDPKTFLDLFNFLKYSKVQSVLKEMALDAVKAGMADG